MSNEDSKIRSEMMPVVRLTLDSMKASIMHMLDPTIIREAIEERLNNAIACFDFESKVKDEAERCISEHIESFFKYGEGGKIIGDAVRAALSETLEKLGKDTDQV